MNKKLPVNNDPYFRTYTHHGFHHAVISSNEKVNINEKDEVARVHIDNFKNKKWEYQSEDLSFNSFDDNILYFYGNIWNTNMNAAFWRKCASTDEIEISIYKQLYSHVYSSIFIFLADDRIEKMTDYDRSYSFVFGNFSKDGIYYKYKNPTYTLLCSSEDFPIHLKFKKFGSEILLIYEDTQHNIQKKQLSLNVSTENAFKIGIGINLRCNNYYDWVFNNYINLYVNLSNDIHIDFLCELHKNWCSHTYNPFLDFSIETESNIIKMGKTLLDYIKEMININKYVEIYINDHIHQKKDTIYFHQNLIYGYDDAEEYLNILFYDKGRIVSTTMSYTDFSSTKNYLSNRTLYIYNYNPAYEFNKIDIEHIIQVFTEYRNSINISFYEPYYDKNFYYGIEGIKLFTSTKGKSFLLSDIRISHLLYERSKCNQDRIDYLYFRKYLDSVSYQKLKKLAQESYKRILIIRNLIIKRQCGGKANCALIIDYFQDYIDIECELSDSIIQVLS